MGGGACRGARGKKLPSPHGARTAFWADTLPWVGCVPSPCTHVTGSLPAGLRETGSGKREEGLGSGRDGGRPPEQKLQETSTHWKAAGRVC